MNSPDGALRFAAKYHKNTYAGKPYIYHLRNVVEIAKQLGYDNQILICCALHDILEDTDIDKNILLSIFGDEIFNIVSLVTNKPGENRKIKHLNTYSDLAKNKKAVAVKLCDRIANIEESIKSNKGLLKMYLSEHDLFMKLLYNESDMFNKNAWSLLTESVNSIQ